MINRTQELYEAVCKITERLPALKRQTIGRRLEDGILHLLELLIMAKVREIGRMRGGWCRSVQ